MACLIAAGTVSAQPTSSGRLGPASRAPSSPVRSTDASPPGPDTRSTAAPMIARCSTARGMLGQAAERTRLRRGAACPGARYPGLRRGGSRCRLLRRTGVAAVVAVAGQFQAEGEEAVQDGGVDGAGDDGDGEGGGGAVPGPVLLRPGHPGLLQSGGAAQGAQFGERDVDQCLDRGADPAGQQAGGDQAAHRIRERAMPPLRLAPGVFVPGRD